MSSICLSGSGCYNLVDIKDSQLVKICDRFLCRKGGRSSSLEILEKLYLYLGKGNSQKGKATFEKYKSYGRVTIEKIGADKNGFSKFYLVVDKQLGVGGWNSCQIGVSQNATLRAIIRPLPGVSDSENLKNAKELRKALGLKYRGPISRVMNCENGVKVTELGGDNLHVLSRTNSLSKKERLIVYKSLLQGLVDLHRHHYVHTDLKTANIVVMKDDEGAITGVKIIDLDRLSKIGESHNTAPEVRYLPYSPERIFVRDQGIASPKDDIWAAMLIICKMESMVSPEVRWLNPSFISKYEEYQDKLEAMTEEELPAYPENQLYTSKSLFGGTNPGTLFENTIFNMGLISPKSRPEAIQILPFLEIVFNSL
ncbi:MAG: hypothetical protein K2X08_08150 [Chlamydiales bacterium]|nr:hypothetical protein [Chlamydiales bacterium]